MYAEKQLITIICKYFQQTPLTRACQFGHTTIAEFLLEEGAVAHPIALIKAIEGLYK